jgi:hypothetical protein
MRKAHFRVVASVRSAVIKPMSCGLCSQILLCSASSPANPAMRSQDFGLLGAQEGDAES